MKYDANARIPAFNESLRIIFEIRAD